MLSLILGSCAGLLSQVPRFMNPSRIAFLTLVILAAAASRLLPHLPNFTPLAAIALLGGASFSNKGLAFFVPLAALFLSDCVIGFHGGMAFVYGAFALTVCLGFLLRRRRRSALAIFTASIASSCAFYLITDFGVWSMDDMYAKTWTGLMECYTAAIPFFRNELLGDLCYSALLFGGLALAEKSLPLLRNTGSREASA